MSKLTELSNYLSIANQILRDLKNNTITGVEAITQLNALADKIDQIDL